MFSCKASLISLDKKTYIDDKGYHFKNWEDTLAYMEKKDQRCAVGPRMDSYGWFCCFASNGANGNVGRQE